jgi:hypothetical protein
MPRPSRGTLLVALLCALITAMPTGAVVAAPGGHGGTPGTIGLKLLDAPVSRRDDQRAHGAIIDHLPPGTVIKRRVQIENHTGDPWPIKVYSGAATVDKNGFLPANGDQPNELTTWTSLDQKNIKVPAQGNQQVWVTIKVPRKASAGERYGVIWAAAEAPPTGAHNLGMVNRIGIRIYLSIGPGGEPPSDFTIESLTPGRAQDGRPFVLAQVHNTGKRALDMSGTLLLTDGPGALRAGPFPAKLGTTLAIGDTEPVSVLLNEQLPNGPWKAQIKLRSGLVERTANATLTFPDAGLGAAVKTYTKWLSSPLLIGLAAALLVAAMLLLRLRAKRRAQQLPA